MSKHYASIRVHKASPKGTEHHKTIGMRMTRDQAADMIAALSAFLVSDGEIVVITTHKDNENADGIHTTVIEG
jgi:hypothetical protein